MFPTVSLNKKYILVTKLIAYRYDRHLQYIMVFLSQVTYLSKLCCEGMLFSVNMLVDYIYDW